MFFREKESTLFNSVSNVDKRDEFGKQVHIIITVSLDMTPCTIVYR